MARRVQKGAMLSAAKSAKRESRHGEKRASELLSDTANRKVLSAILVTKLEGADGHTSSRHFTWLSFHVSTASLIPMWKLSTGEPYAGKPHVRFGGRGERVLFSTPIVSIHVSAWLTARLEVLMNSSFQLHLQSATRYERIEAVTSFVGQDASGSFGILPGRAGFMTILSFGLARFRVADGPWKFIACPGAVLSFEHNALCLNTRRYLVDDDYGRISGLLVGKLTEEEHALKAVKDNIRQLEQELLRRLHQLNRSP